VKKNIFVVRHGHAENSATHDFDRVLTMTGILAVNKTAEYISKICLNQSITIDLCICSAAHRTKQTAEIICFKNNIQIAEFHNSLYSTVASQWIDKMSESKYENILLVGHNPTLSQLVNNICGQQIYMQPANCAHITLELEQDGIIYPAQLNQFYKHE
jgi:phosphohistidine phosphatase